MNRFSQLIAPVALGIGMSLGSSAQASEPSYENPEKRPEVIRYKDEIRSRVDRGLSPFGLRYEGVRGQTFRSYHIGYPLGESGLSIGATYIGEKGSIPELEKTRSDVVLGVQFALKFK